MVLDDDDDALPCVAAVAVPAMAVIAARPSAVVVKVF